MIERDEQAAVFEWAEWKANQDPAYRLMYAVPNGQYRPGQRPEPGLKAGVPDICLPVPRGGYHGLYLELKVGDNQPTAKQEWWLEALADWGYITAVAWGFDDAVAVIETYMEHSECIADMEVTL